MNQYAIILVGKDGGEKFRTRLSPFLDDIFKLIDAMPMRRAKLSQRGQRFAS